MTTSKNDSARHAKGKTPLTEATMLVYNPDGTEMCFPVPNSSLRVGDLVLLEKGKYIPADTKILTGRIAAVADGDEMPAVSFGQGDIATGGLLVVEGRAKGYVSAPAGEEKPAVR